MESPILVPIKERYRLNHSSSQKETYHVVLDLKECDLNYSVGDCLGIYPSNDPESVDDILQTIGATGLEAVTDREGTPRPFKTFLSHHANIVRASKKLRALLKIEHDQGELIDVLKESKGACMDAQKLSEYLAPLIPRFYSIASSMNEVGREAHLTIALTQYDLEGQKRFGTCSRFLCTLAPLNTPLIPIYVHKAREFVLTDESFSKPIIMVGPGTGIAPFRGFMQERKAKKASKNWLFFGERNAKHDFYYEEYWRELVKQGELRLDVAFSRDQEEKIYVQHKMLENAQELWQWLQEGAYFFVCGDASRMAKDVDQTLQKIAEQEGRMSPEEAKEYLKSLRKQKRYLRDVY